MADTEYTAALQMLIARIDAQDTAAVRSDAAAARREELLTKINGYVRDHGEQLAAHTEWIRTHDGRHKRLEQEQKSLSNRIWSLGGGGSLLAIVTAIVQIFNSGK